MTSPRTTIRIGLLINAFLLAIITIPVILLNDGSSTYLRCGWYDDFILISVPINTRLRYIYLNVFIILIKIMDVMITELVQPKISYPIYNPDKKIIYEFTKNELHFYGNTLYLMESMKEIILVLITITQIDIALASMLFGELTSIITIRMLLNDKKFISITENDDSNEEENLL